MYLDKNRAMIGIFEGEGRSPEIDAFGRTARASERARAVGHISRATLFILKSRKAHSVRAARPSHFRSRRTEGREEELDDGRTRTDGRRDCASHLSPPSEQRPRCSASGEWRSGRRRASATRETDRDLFSCKFPPRRSNNTLFLSWETILCQKSRVRQHCVVVHKVRRALEGAYVCLGQQMLNSLGSLRTASCFFLVKISTIASPSVPFQRRTSISAEANESRWHVGRGVRSLDWGQQH